MNLLKRLQQASSSAKAQISFIGALVVTLLIAVVWATTLPIRFSPEKTLTGNSEAIEKANTPSVWTGFTDALKDQLASVRDAALPPPTREELDITSAGESTVAASEEAFSFSLGSTTSTGEATTTPAVAPVPVLIQVLPTGIGTGSTSEVTSQNAIPAPKEATPLRTILIATTTGSGTQTAP